MQILLPENVLEAAQKRISFLFDEFENVAVNFSGGKDSTVCLELTLAEARKRGRLPLPVMFIDQEAEWQMTIDYVKEVMYREEVKPYWLQVPIKLFNATSHSEEWLDCWKDGDEWIRPKDPIAITENVYGTDRFKEMFGAFAGHEFGERSCSIGGVRCEESPARTLGMTSMAVYKDITWGKRQWGEEHIVFYPIYDWSYTDVWKYIHDNKLKYNRVYDYFYNFGLDVRRMRVSNLHHETAVMSLYMLQEIEPDTWNALTKRLSGVDTSAKIALKDNFTSPKKLPFMFKNWKEYRDYLLENLVESEETRKLFKKKFEDMEPRYIGMAYPQALYQAQITTILANDYYFTKLQNFETGSRAHSWKIYRRGGTPDQAFTFIPVKENK